VLGRREVAGLGAVEVVEEDVGKLAGEDDHLDVGVLVELADDPVQSHHGFGDHEVHRGLTNVILAVRGVMRSRVTVLDRVMSLSSSSVAMSVAMSMSMSGRPGRPCGRSIRPI